MDRNESHMYAQGTINTGMHIAYCIFIDVLWISFVNCEQFSNIITFLKHGCVQNCPKYAKGFYNFRLNSPVKSLPIAYTAHIAHCTSIQVNPTWHNLKPEQSNQTVFAVFKYMEKTHSQLASKIDRNPFGWQKIEKREQKKHFAHCTQHCVLKL